jgi:uncharacterized membrane protein
MRYVSIDILRAVAIVLMVLVHFMENLGGADWAPAGFGAPLFTFLVGVSYRLWLDSQYEKKRPTDEITRTSARRGAFLFAVGFAFNVLVWLPEDAFNWDVLTLIGSALLLLCAIRDMPLLVPLAGVAVALVCGPVMRELGDYDSYWAEGYYDPDWTWGQLALGYIATGYFPLFPWVAYPLAGFVTASLFFVPGERAPTGRAMLLGGALVALAVALLVARPYLPTPVRATVLKGWTMFPPSVEYTLGTLGGTLLAFAALHRWLDPNGARLEGTRLLRVATTFSKYSLSMYLFHHIVHLWPVWVYGAFAGETITEYWRYALPVWAAIPLAVLCLIAGYVLFAWIDRTKRSSAETLMRRWCG